MGQNISNQPKLSGEITLNRIRSTCQRDDKMPAELKSFNIALLANDLNALGMDIPIVDLHGRKRSADDICNDIKHATYPDVESVCMVSNKQNAHVAVENMVNNFNKNYGARIQLYKDPLNKSRGKRNLSELCDDLYLVLDKVHRKLTDQPRVIKQKLEDMILMLEERKNAIESRMGPVIASISHARESDKTNQQIKTADTLYKATNSLLNAQLRGAHALAANTIENLDINAFETLGHTGLAGSLGHMKNNLSQYEGARFASNRNVTDTVKQLLVAATNSGLALNDCDKCMKKLSIEIGSLDTDTMKRHKQLHDGLVRSISQTSSNEEIEALMKCYTTLLKEAGCNVVSNSSELYSGVVGQLNNDKFHNVAATDQDYNINQLIGMFVPRARARAMSSTGSATYGKAITGTAGTAGTAGVV